MKFKTEAYIESKYVQSNQYVRFPYFVRIFQDAAFEHSKSLGLDVNDFLSRGLAWVLYSMYIEAYCYPKLGDMITISTWCKHKKYTLVERDYEVTYVEKSILKATTKWVLFNIYERKAIQIPDSIISIFGQEDFDILPYAKNRLPYDKNIDYSYNYKFNTHFLDLDSNDHVNNINHIDYVCTAIYRILKIPIFVKTFNIIYKKEITINNEEIYVYLNLMNEFCNFKIVNNHDLFSYGCLTYNVLY